MIILADWYVPGGFDCLLGWVILVDRNWPGGLDCPNELASLGYPSGGDYLFGRAGFS